MSYLIVSLDVSLTSFGTHTHTHPGVIWPVQAIPVGLRWLSLSLPTTWAAAAMRSVLNRGWGFTQGDVWIGFTVVFAWILFFMYQANKGLRNRD